jgi:CBS domain-containing protein
VPPVTYQSRLARKSTVRECQALLAIEPLIVTSDQDLLAVMRRSSVQPETRLIGVVDPETNKLVGVLPTLRVAEGVIARVVPESLMTDLADIDDIASFGREVEERTAGQAMQEPATVAEDATIVDAFRVMHRRHLSGLYVVDAEQRPTGYIDLLELALRYVEALESAMPGAVKASGLETAGQAGTEPTEPEPTADRDQRA